MTAPTGPRQPRAAVALPAALAFIVFLDVLVIAALFGVVRHRRGSNARVVDAALTAAADDALLATAGAWSPVARAAMRIGAADTARSAVAEPLPIVVETRTTRLSEAVFWVVADARSEAARAVPADIVVGGGRRRFNLVLRVPSSPLDGSAIASKGDVRLGAGARVLPDSGGAANGGCTPRPGLAAPVVLAPNATLLMDSAAPPAAVRAPLLDDAAAALSLGAEGWPELVARAALRLPAGATHDATLPPLTYAEGDLTLRGGAGSGVLLVEGRLTVAGPLAFAGLVVTRGGVQNLGNGGGADSVIITGLVLSVAPGSDSTGAKPVDLSGAIRVQGSRCAVRRALAAALRPVRVRTRGWSELF